MKLRDAIVDILSQLNDVLKQIQQSDYARSASTLSGGTVGQHIRHTIEFLMCLEKGFTSGVVNYDKREHDELIEGDKRVAQEALAEVLDFLGLNRDNRYLTLEMSYALEKEELITIESNFHRELAYNIEHAVHHMALIKIGLREVAGYVQLPAHFGVAASSVRYQSMVRTN